MADISRRAHLLRLKTGSAVGALAADLDLSAATDAPDEESSGLLAAGTFLTSLSHQDRQRLRQIVKKVHLRNQPGSMITDREADRVIEAMGPITQEKLIRKAVEHGMFS